MTLSSSTVAGLQHGTPWQRSSHDALLSARSVRGVSGGERIDAIVVPASRGEAHLTHLVRLSADLSATLVVLCSRHTRAGDVAPLVEREPGATAVLLDVPFGYSYSLIPRGTSADQFRSVTANRHKDLSLKRNLGLLLARLNGWRKILFLDDDIGSARG